MIYTGYFAENKWVKDGIVEWFIKFMRNVSWVKNKHFIGMRIQGMTWEVLDVL